MLVQFVFMAICFICIFMHTTQVNAFDSTEIRLLEWPRGPKSFTKRSDILETGLLGPLARFRKSENMRRIIRNSGNIMKDPIIRFGKRSQYSEPRFFQRVARAYRLQNQDPMPEFWQ